MRRSSQWSYFKIFSLTEMEVDWKKAMIYRQGKVESGENKPAIKDCGWIRNNA